MPFEVRVAGPAEFAARQDVAVVVIRDAGMTEIEAGTATVVVVG
jgi:peptidyl-tRNA hydrolase